MWKYENVEMKHSALSVYYKIAQAMSNFYHFHISTFSHFHILTLDISGSH